MSKNIGIIPFALAMLLVSGWAWAQAPPPERTVPVGEETLAVLGDEPQVHMRAAAQLHKKKDYHGAAREIRKARAFLEIESARGAEQARAELRRSAAELGTLASDVEKGAVKSGKTLEAAFARAERALAVHQREQAVEYWAKDDAKRAGASLDAASRHLENAWKWVGEKAHAATEKTISESRRLGKKLAEGGTWVKTEVADGLASLGAEIETLGKKFAAEPKK